jgi:hypothetical protein
VLLGSAESNAHIRRLQSHRAVSGSGEPQQIDHESVEMILH